MAESQPQPHGWRETSDSLEARDAAQRELIDHFRPEIEARLKPTRVMSHMTGLDCSGVREAEDRSGSTKAARLLIDKLLKWNEPGWFWVFVVALQTAEFTYLADLLNGEHVYQSPVLDKLFLLHKPKLERIDPLIIVNTLQSLGCLGKEDLSEIKAAVDFGGNFKGRQLLLDLVSRKDKDWFPKLMFALAIYGQSDIVKAITNAEEVENINDWEEMRDLIGKLIKDQDMLDLQEDYSKTSLLDEKVYEYRFEYSSIGKTCGPKLHAAQTFSEQNGSQPSPEGKPTLDFECAPLADAHKPSLKTPTELAEEHSPDDHGPLNSLANNLNQDVGRKPCSTCKSVEPENELGDSMTTDTKPKMLDLESVPNEGTDGSGATSDNEIYLNIEEPEEKPLELRGYQMELAQPAVDGKNIIVSAPTGTGKTHVALKIVQEHFRKADTEQEPKVAFLVPTVELVRQQWTMFKTYIQDHKSVGIHGDLLKKLPVGCLIHHYEIVILTPQILVNALKDKSVSSLSLFSLLLYDECHHAMKGHPYARVQYYYLTSKLQSPDQPTNLPQVVGLTASVGVGKKTRTLEGAVNHILKLCAHLDVEILKTVEKNRRELDKYENKPNEERKEVKGRVRDPFYDEVSRIMNIIETRIKRAPELRSLPDQQTAQQLAAPPGERGGERYTEWLGKLKKPVARIRDQDQRRFFHACTNHLEIYNCSLVVNADCRTVDALKVIEKKMLKLKPEQEDDTDKWLSQMFGDHKDSLQQVADDPRNSNPKLEVVKRMIYEGYQKNPDNLRCIMFVKTREMTEALAKWINEDGELKHLAASSLAGKGPSTAKAGMNQAQQKDVLQYFKDGKHKVIVATTVAEEGLDIQKCNLVIRYEHVTNEIAYVQARGRGRAEGADYYLVGGAGSGTVEREEINLMREQLMEKAIKKIREMKEKTFQRHINLYQQEIRREWMRAEARKNRRVRRASDDDEDVYELRCIRSNHLACFSSDIRKVKDSHHVVTDLKMLEVVNIEPHPRPDTYDAFTKLGKLFCKECGEDWGIQVLYKGIKLPVIKISAFVVVFPNGARDNFKKWSQSPFDNDLAPLEDEELNEYNDELEELDLQ